MPLISVPAVYDGTNIALLEKPPSPRIPIGFVFPKNRTKQAPFSEHDTEQISWICEIDEIT
jgi:hypothetical protein